MAKRIWEFPELSEIGDNTLFLVSDGQVTRTVPGSLIRLIDARINNIIQGTATDVSASEIVDARLQADGTTAATLGDAIRCGYSAAIQKMQYRPGDSFTQTHVQFAGQISGTNGNRITAFIPLAKPLDGVTGISFVNPDNSHVQIRGAGGYLWDEGLSVMLEADAITLIPMVNGIRFVLSWEGGLISKEHPNVNNAPVSVYIYPCTIKFT